MKGFNLFVSVAFLGAMLLLSSCKKDENPVSPPSGGTNYVGTIAGNSESGSMSFNIPSSSAKWSPSKVTGVQTLLTITGTLKIAGGATITLTGTFNTENDSIRITGGGYTFAGELVGGKVQGSYDGPSGSGTFAVQSSSSSSTVKVYLGSYHETSPTTTETGVINIVVDGTSVTVLVTSGEVYYGTISGNAVTIYLSGTSGTVLASGNLSGSTMSGTYNTGDSSGSWTATLN